MSKNFSVHQDSFSMSTESQNLFKRKRTATEKALIALAVISLVVLLAILVGVILVLVRVWPENDKGPSEGHTVGPGKENSTPVGPTNGGQGPPVPTTKAATSTTTTTSARSTTTSTTTRPTPPPSNECGQRKVNLDSVNPFIINGVETVRGEFPWHVAIIYNQTLFANGAILNDRWIITSGLYAKLFKVPSLVYVAAGTNDLTKISDSPDVQEPIVDRVEIHQYWSNKDTHLINDIALLHLTRPIFKTETLQPICLPQHASNISALKNCIFTGFGTTQPGGKLSYTLRKGRMTPRSYDECQEGFRKLFSGNLPPTEEDFEHFYCAGTTPFDAFDAVNHCSFDGGGPLVCEDTQQQRWKLVGVASFRYGDDCDMSFFARVTSFVNWINDKMST